jgi:aldose 1-epimerase
MRNLSRFRSSPVYFCIALLLLPRLTLGSKIEHSGFGTSSDHHAIEQYTLTNDAGASVSFLNYGATITSLKIPDKNGKISDVVLGCNNIEQYENQSPYFGAIIGRVANRIAHGMFSIGDRHYALAINNGPNHLHGGFRGYDKRVWNAETIMTADGPSIRFTLKDPDGCEGYPGNVHVTVIYSLEADNTLKIQYFATADQPTPINLTNHSYFNLKDDGKTDILGHVMRIHGDHYTPVDSTLIPTGEIAPVKGTPIDFTTAKPIGRDLKAMGGNPIGYDHNVVLFNQTGDLALAVEVYEPESGRYMQVWTTEPGVQFYSGNFLDGSIKGKNGNVYHQYAAFVLECQHYPDSVNHSNFPSVILKPGEVYRQITEYRFSTADHQPF